MVFVVIGIMLAVAVGAIIKQRSRQSQIQDAEQPGGTELEQQAGAGTTESGVPTPAGMDIADVLSLSPVAEQQKEPDAEKQPPVQVVESLPIVESLPKAGSGLEEEIIPLKPVMAAEPISSPSALNSATYASLAPQSAAADSPYAYGNTADDAKPKAESTLLRWSGKTGALQIGDLTVRGPVTYWSDGPSSTYDPSCIDIQLPVAYPDGESETSFEGVASYKEMLPLQRGMYLLWLAEGRIQPPSHACYVLIWLFGLERRVLADRLDVGICIGEAFRLLPIVRWDSLRQGLIKFITWMAAKVWLPEEELLAFSRSLPSVPKEILNMLLRPYADAHLPLPSVIAFTVMRASPLAEENGLAQPQPFLYSNDLMAQFASKYKSKCSGGLVLTKPKTSVFVAYAPTNPTLIGDKKASGGVLELPDFFGETEIFAPLIAAWKEFLKEVFPPPAEPLSALEELEARPNWDSFIRNLHEAGADEVLSNNSDIFAAPVTANLGAVADLMGIDRSKGSPKIDAADRKKISEAARVEGFLILPDLGIAGKEYRWDEPVSLSPFPPGARVPQDYSTAALTLEYACALAGVSDSATLTVIREGLKDYFRLSPEDEVRLEALSSVLVAEPAAEARTDPNNLGGSLQFWLQQEQRAIFGKFMARFLSGLLVPEKDWGSVIRESLDLDITLEPYEKDEKDEKDLKSLDTEETTEGEKENSQLLELGSKIVEVLSPLFKD